MYKVLSLFSGMGGMDIGFAEQVIVHKDSIASTEMIQDEHTIDGFVRLRREPFEIVFQNDILPSAQRLLELNHWSKNFHLKDIREILASDYVFPTADVVIGGFPCQDFSHAGKRKGLESQRGTLYQAYVEVVRRVQPKVFIAENVNGLLTMPNNPLQTIKQDFMDVGYNVKHQLIKCEEFGIPQTRWRVIIMGVRNDLVENLEPSEWNIIEENRIQCSIGAYFVHLQEPSVTLDPAQQMFSKAKALEKGQGQKEISLQRFAPTMRAEHHGNIEFRRKANGINNEPTLPERRLTVREAALIQTFPPECILTEERVTMMAYKPIGNAVPPLLGYLLARKVKHILQILLDGRDG
jgi:DNA (cytosine-5)-methyltransferase 1